MAQWVVFFVGLACILYYLIYFTGAFITSDPTRNIADVLGKIGLTGIFISWLFANKKPSPSGGSGGNRLLRYHLVLLTIAVLLLLSVYNFIWPPFTNALYQHPPMFDLSSTFESLPFNDLSWLRDYSNEYIMKWFRLVYLVGFTMPILIPCLICFLQRRYIQGWHYIFSGHLLQLCLAFPLYALISVDEIWVVKHLPDGLLRVFPDQLTAAAITMNNFPSMHTSVAFASLLVAQREPDTLFRYTWTFFLQLRHYRHLLFPYPLGVRCNRRPIFRLDQCSLIAKITCATDKIYAPFYDNETTRQRREGNAALV
ncbi:MAG: hypothetical protein P4N59_06185 [Negativicutes bacterium]|nr:hypothetical protein [Negativicutes bacterium]